MTLEQKNIKSYGEYLIKNFRDLRSREHNPLGTNILANYTFSHLSRSKVKMLCNRIEKFEKSLKINVLNPRPVKLVDFEAEQDQVLDVVPIDDDLSAERLNEVLDMGDIGRSILSVYEKKDLDELMLSKGDLDIGYLRKKMSIDELLICADGGEEYLRLNKKFMTYIETRAGFLAIYPSLEISCSVRSALFQLANLYRKIK